MLDFWHERFFQSCFDRKKVFEKIGEFLTTSSIKNVLEDDSAVLKVLYLKIVCVTIKKNHTDKEIPEKLDMDLKKSDDINNGLILTSRRGSAARLEVLIIRQFY